MAGFGQAKEEEGGGRMREIQVGFTVVSVVFLILSSDKISHPLDARTLICLATSAIFALLAIAWRPE